MPKRLLPVGIGFFAVHVFVTGLYSSVTVLPPSPPNAYIFPFATAAPSPVLAVGIGCLTTQESSVALAGCTLNMHKESTLRKTSKRAMLLVLFTVLIVQCIYFL